jgi:hypothetical protein
MIPGLNNMGRQAQAAASSGFNPTDLFGASEAGIWMDPTTGVWQETAETNLADADTDVVGRWKDQSGNGHNYDQGTTANKPLFKTSAGLSWLQFDGTDDYLSQAANIGLYGAGVGYVAFAVDAAVTSNSYFFGESDTSVTQTFAYTLLASGTDYDAAGDYRPDASGNDIASVKILDTTVYQTDGKAVVEVVDTGTNFEVFVDGVSGDGADNPVSYTRRTTTLNASVIGALLRTTASNWGAFDCYGLFAIGRAVTAQERTDMRTFLNGRLGI